MSDELNNDAISKLTRDLRNAAKLMGVREARYFVNTYYDMQDYRIGTGNQQRKLLEGQEPSEFMTWLNSNLQVLENQIRTVLDKWSAAQPMGAWAREITGIGPVISAGLIANIDITKAPTTGHIWRYAGLDPTRKWEKGQKRPWNASLKRLCWLMGESFVKVSAHKNDVYGKHWIARKQYEIDRNEIGYNAEEAKRRIAEDDKKAPSRRMEAGLRAILETGKLPAIAMHERSKRWAVKLFLSHWHDEAYRQRYNQEPPLPYPIAHMGHAHFIPGPSFSPGAQPTV
jgi:hypothetical protein